jgi:hypothetical protein
MMWAYLWGIGLSTAKGTCMTIVPNVIVCFAARSAN